MRSLLLCLALFMCLANAAPHRARAIRRQDEGPSIQSPTPSLSRPSRPSATPSLSRTSSSPQSDATSTADISVNPSSSSAASTGTHGPVTTTSHVPQPSSSAGDDSENPLPIHPKITPAMGLAGAILLVTGLVYAVIGIKNKWIYVFGSTAYLTALAVTVLIVYLMNPPVSDGVQGAFFVAAFLTGIIFGVLSLVFADITEGFGCLLGGFCLSMWLLSLKDGGLISSTTGRAIFIGCMSAGGFGLSFSHHTRNYGLIASIAFSGATATILGIDCLACAGWKEFWLYLWSLNEDVFPLNTTTYPVTKNIKAELAGVVIITVFGIVSQLRVWNLVKDRRAASAVQEQERQEQLDRAEEENGRLVEDKFQKERAQWEAAYGDKSTQDSSVTSSSIASPKMSTSVSEKEVYATDSLEMNHSSKAAIESAGTMVTAAPVGDDEIQHVEGDENPVRHTEPAEITNNDDFHAADSASDNEHRSLAPRGDSAPPPPPIVPLPFTVPEEDEVEDNTSVSAVPDSQHEDDFARRPMSKRVSDMSAIRRVTLDPQSPSISKPEQALPEAPSDRELPEPTDYPQDDRATSVAATMQDTEAHNGSLTDAALPQRLSKVAMSYRTNEWAKHLETAERPDLDAPHVPTSPGVALEVLEEAPAPVSEEIAYSMRTAQRNSSWTSSNPRTSIAPLNRSASTLSDDSLLDKGSMNRPSPVASPGGVSRADSGVDSDALAPLPSNTLLGQRQSLMRKRTSSSSFTPTTSAANLLEKAEQDNMTLAQRRQILQHHQATSPGLQLQTPSTSLRKPPPSSAQKWQKKAWATTAAPSGFDSHQPKRTTSSSSDRKREELYAGWRGSMRDMTPPQTQAYTAEQQRAALLNERQQKEMDRKRRESAQQQRASMMDSMMRNPQMLDAHREAMRKMQSNATRNAS